MAPKVNIIFSDNPDELKAHLSPYRKVFAVFDRNAGSFARTLLGKDIPALGIEASEEFKTAEAALEICRWLISSGADRDALLLCIGGGVTSDIAGFAASVYKRGIRFAVVPTTLLAMTDAAIGGKSGVNLDSLKNMVGTIRQPEFTFICPQPLGTLPRRQFLSGAAELLKTFIISSEEDYVKAVSVLSGGEPYEGLWQLVQKAARFKADIVETDEREKDIRRILNLGHTWGHAIEWYQQKNRIRNPYTHGEAVAIGIIQAAEESVRQGLCDPSLPARLKADFTACSLPVGLPCDKSDLLEAISQDKKSRDGHPGMVLLEGIGKLSPTRVTCVRAKIALADKAMAEAFSRRMQLSAEMAGIKKKEGLQIFDATQEAKVLKRAGQDIADKSLEEPYKELMTKVLELSRKHQHALVEGRFGLLGEHLSHSFSPRLHASLGRSAYELIEIAPDGLETFIKARGFNGLNVTIPYKKKVMPLLDSVSDGAREAGAVNTIVNCNGTLKGYNTDIDGFISLARHTGVDFAGARVLILGGGGAAGAVRAASLRMGAASVIHAVRSPRRGQLRLGPELGGDFDIMVNATPVGMFPDVEGIPVNLDLFPHLKGVLDCVYNPLRTSLVLKARERGIRAEGGLAMLVAQACRSHELFGGDAISPEREDALIDEMQKDLENIAFCGMPSCGKSTLGKILAERLGREFIDTDALIEQREGRTISEIFASDGESCFRKLESGIAAEISGRNSLVVALGGGAVLSEDNVRLLKMNSRLVLLDRSLGNLTPGGGRPLSSTVDALEKLYRERMPVYRRVADEIMKNDGALPIEFTKMQGLGNDYIFIDEEKFPVADPGALSKKVSDRRRGIGSDGLVLIGRSARADFSMKIYNADGSRAQMCGNAARCVARYVYDRGLTSGRDITLETGSGIRALHVLDDGRVRVEMGGFEVSRMEVSALGQRFEGWSVNVGNPHFVIFGDAPRKIEDILRYGPVLERHSAFPEGVNVEFAFIPPGCSGRIEMKVWERGSGHTLACGTGACATAAAAISAGLLEGPSCTVEMEGGALEISIENGLIHMTGPAEKVCDGVIEDL